MKFWRSAPIGQLSVTEAQLGAERANVSFLRVNVLKESQAAPFAKRFPCAGFLRCETPLAAFKNEHVVAFTMVNCAPKKDDSYAVARGAYEWYARASADSISDLSDWVESRSGDLGTYSYTDKIRTAARSGSKEVALNFDAMMGKNSVISGDPDEVIERARQYEAAGVDQLLCLLNPHDIPHASIMQTIELMGKYVLPEFR